MLAGDSLRRILLAFTGGPVRGVALGTFLTVLVQSSHVTTVATIGFVSAGLISFEQSLGVIFGANLGTTSIGWIVSLLGFKMKIAVIAMFILLAGAALRVLGSGRAAKIGTILAGFALIFIGVDLIQNGMGSSAGIFSLTGFATDSLTSRLALCGIGILMTVITQSSGAALTITLSALALGQIDLLQGALLVIGQNIGTTLTAALAGIGAAPAARKTALSHIMFNVITGIIVFLFIDFYAAGLTAFFARIHRTDALLELSLFHTAFNFTGIVLLLPAARPFSRLLDRMMPPGRTPFTENLDRHVTALPALAVEAARRSCLQVATASAGGILRRIGGDAPDEKLTADASGAIQRIREFMSSVHASQGVDYERQRSISILHATEHLEYLVDLMREPHSLALARESAIAVSMRTEIERILAEIPRTGEYVRTDHIRAIADEAARFRKAEREKVLGDLAAGAMTPDAAFALIEEYRWFERISYRLSRTMHYLLPEERRQSRRRKARVE